MNKKLLSEINARIDTLTAAHAAEVKQIEDAITKCKADQTAALAAIEAASDALDVDAHQAATAELSKLRTLEQMYLSRLEKIQNKRTVTEKESDQVIQELLQHEKDIAEEYRAAIAPKLSELKAITDRYHAEVQRTEDTISRWTGDVHPNYHNFGVTHIDKETGERTDKNGHPHPVHLIPYKGCAEADRVTDFFSRYPEMLPEE